MPCSLGASSEHEASAWLYTSETSGYRERLERAVFPIQSFWNAKLRAPASWLASPSPPGQFAKTRVPEVFRYGVRRPMLREMTSCESWVRRPLSAVSFQCSLQSNISPTLSLRPARQACPASRRTASHWPTSARQSMVIPATCLSESRYMHMHTLQIQTLAFLEKRRFLHLCPTGRIVTTRNMCCSYLQGVLGSRGRLNNVRSCLMSTTWSPRPWQL